MEAKAKPKRANQKPREKTKGKRAHQKPREKRRAREKIRESVAMEKRRGREKIRERLATITMCFVCIICVVVLPVHDFTSTIKTRCKTLSQRDKAASTG